MATVLLTMEIDNDTQPIRGRVHITGDPATFEFVGWVQLVQMLERVRGGDPATATATATDSHRLPSP